MWALAAVVLVVVIGGLLRWLVMQQYNVGEEGGQVAIFQGIQGGVLGFQLHSTYETTEIKVTDLQEDARTRVQQGIQQGGLAEAQQTVDRLRTREMLPICAPPVPQTPVPSPNPQAPGAQPPGTPAGTPATLTSPEPQETNTPCRTVS
jgi:protein phosphatase